MYTLVRSNNTNIGHETYKSSSDLVVALILIFLLHLFRSYHIHQNTRWRLYLFFIVARRRSTTAELSLTQQVWSLLSRWFLFQSPGRWCRRYLRTSKLAPGRRMPGKVEIFMINLFYSTQKMRRSSGLQFIVANNWPSIRKSCEIILKPNPIILGENQMDSKR